MMDFVKRVILISAFLSCQILMNAQNPMNALDTIPGKVEQLQSGLKNLNKLKVSGYIQFQWQHADTIGSAAAFSGGDFKKTDNRFMIRRGRIKFAYTNELSQYVLQFDVTEKGMGIKDAYISLTDPWLKTVTLTGGAFNRPFGYEIEFSSGSRETPERSRIFQTLFNQERDLGAKIKLQAPKSSPWHLLKLDAGLFGGNGLNVETDPYKDFIGHLSATKTFNDENIHLGLGVSYYNGGWAAGTKYIYRMSDISTPGGTVKGFQVDSTGYKVGDRIKREYFGVDGQMSVKSALGMTTLRGEYLWGTQPATEKTSSSPTGAWMKEPTTVYSTTVDETTHEATTTAKTVTNAYNPYIRSFQGGYVYLGQSLGQSKHELMCKYDWYDPNTKISGHAIGANGSFTGAPDLKYSTWGFGWIYHWNKNVKVTAYYEVVDNEVSNQKSMSNGSKIKTYGSDQSDNVFTFRIQYKF